MMKDCVFGTCDGWSHGYSTAMIIGATYDQIVERAKTIKDWEYVFYNYDDTNDKCVYLDVYRWMPHEVCNFFNEIGEDVAVYAAWHWDEDMFVAEQNHKAYDKFIAVFTDDSPRESDEEGQYDIDVEIKDIATGCSICVGGGMCDADEKEFYENLVKSHHNKDAVIKTVLENVVSELNDVILLREETTFADEATVWQNIAFAKDSVDKFDEKLFSVRVEKLKKELFMSGVNAIEDFLGSDLSFDDDDALDNAMDEVAEQMPAEELEKFFKKYGVM